MSTVRKGVPLRPVWPTTSDDDLLRSLTRAALATGLAAALDGARPSEVEHRNWSDDRAVGLVLRSAVSPTMTTNAPGARAADRGRNAAIV
jgi:hypothetical protein